MGLPAQGETNLDYRQRLGLSPHIQEVRPVHRSMAKTVIFGGARPGQLAQIYGYTPGQISRIMGSPAFQAECCRLERMADQANLDMRKEITTMAPQALANLEEDINILPQDLGERKLRQSASLEVLGLAGVRKTGGTQINLLLDQSNHEEIHVGDLNVDDLRDEITDLCKGDDGTYE